MRLSDIVSAARETGYAEAALVIFLAVFGLIVLAQLLRRDRGAIRRAASLPLEEDGAAVGVLAADRAAGAER